MGTSAFGGFCVSRRFCLTRKDADKGAEERGSARIDALEKRKKEGKKKRKAWHAFQLSRNEQTGLVYPRPSAPFSAFFRVKSLQVQK
jgi:hypothetical protein